MNEQLPAQKKDKPSDTNETDTTTVQQKRKPTTEQEQEHKIKKQNNNSTPNSTPTHNRREGRNDLSTPEVKQKLFTK